jgi:hypothetical protein
MMKYQLLTTDNHTIFVENYLLQQFDDYKSFIQLQYLFTIIPIPIPTYNYDYMEFIFYIVKYYVPNFWLYYHIDCYIRKYIIKNNVYDYHKILNDLNNIKIIIIKFNNPLIIHAIDRYLHDFTTSIWFERTFNVKKRR